MPCSVFFFFIFQFYRIVFNPTVASPLHAALCAYSQLVPRPTRFRKLPPPLGPHGTTEKLAARRRRGSMAPARRVVVVVVHSETGETGISKTNAVYPPRVPAKILRFAVSRRAFVDALVLTVS